MNMKSRWFALAMCAVLMVPCVPLPPAASADGGTAATAEAPSAEQQAVIVDDANIEGWNQEKFWTYLGCGVAIAVSVGGAGVVAVAIACGRAATLYWNR